MYLFLFALTVCARAGAGEIAGALQTSPGDPLPKGERLEDPVTEEERISEDSSASVKGTKDNINRGEDSDDGGIEIPTSSGTSTEHVACLYRMPERAQVDAMLSDMMNQLTRVFVRMENHLRASQRGRGGREKRYRLVSRGGANFFEHIFANMTQEFRVFLNESTSNLGHMGRDPCAHQPELRQLWRSLLDNAQSSYWKAAVRCVDELMLPQALPRGHETHKSQESSKRKESPEKKESPKRMKSPERKESSETQKSPKWSESGWRRSAGEGALRELMVSLRSLRASQIATLCHRFHLCYYELL